MPRFVQPHNARYASQSTETKHSTQTQLGHFPHLQRPDDRQREYENDDVRYDVVDAICSYELDVVESLCGFHISVPGRADRDSSEGVGKERRNAVACVQADHEPAGPDEPSLDKDAFVQEDKRDAGEGVAY